MHKQLLALSRIRGPCRIRSSSTPWGRGVEALLLAGIKVSKAGEKRDNEE